MRILCKKYPSIEIFVENTLVRFVDGVADVEEGLAMKLTAMNPDYVVEKEQMQGYIPFNGATWTDDYKKIIWDGPIGYNNGYGNGSMKILEALSDKLDVYSVASHWKGSTTEFIPEKLAKVLKKPSSKIDSYYVMFFPAWEFTRKISQRFIGYTMLEATRIPQSWVDNCNNYCERVIVPCEQQRQAFIDSGVTVDVKSIPLGVNPELFPQKSYDKVDDAFVFGTMGTLTYRKGTDLLVKAYKKLFPKDKYPNVHLSIKTLSVAGIGRAWFMDREDLTQDPRIIINTDSFSPTELVENFFHTLDCFVFPTRGEGFGLPPLEAMCVGLPVICTNFSGCSEFMDPKVSFPIGYDLVDVPIGDWRGYPPELRAEGQQWAEPNFDELCDRMMYVYENRDKANKIGQKARQYVLKNFTADLAADRLIQYLTEKK